MERRMGYLFSMLDKLPEVDNWVSNVVNQSSEALGRGMADVVDRNLDTSLNDKFVKMLMDKNKIAGKAYGLVKRKWIWNTVKKVTNQEKELTGFGVKKNNNINLTVVTNHKVYKP